MIAPSFADPCPVQLDATQELPGPHSNLPMPAWQIGLATHSELLQIFGDAIWDALLSHLCLLRGVKAAC